MTEPYLILHKVRGQPAFDIATKLPCPMCESLGCEECGEGFWWIIPTSGHRAYPWWNIELYNIDDTTCLEPNSSYPGFRSYPDIPKDWPDHYSCNDRPAKAEPKPSLLAQLGLGLKGIVRRI